MGDRRQTEREIELSALRLLQRDGVLAGVNLREVADEAGINRGLVYQYYGSRRALLRAALRSDVGSRLAAVRRSADRPLRERMVQFMRAMRRYGDAVKLVTVLVLDDDDELVLTPLRVETGQRLRADVEDGTLDPSLAHSGVHAAMVSMAWGYSTYRRHLARELDVPLTTLDRQVDAVVDRMMAGLAPRVDTAHGGGDEGG